MSAPRRVAGFMRNNWRITLLVVLVLIASYFLFVPGATIGDSGTVAGEANTGVTNLQFGIDLAGGARISAPPQGLTAEDVSITSGDQADEVTQTLTSALNITERDVRIDTPDGTVEVFEPNVSEGQFRNALQSAGLSDFSIRDGVTSETRSLIVDVLSNRIDAIGFGGANVRSFTTAGGESFIEVESPGRTVDELRDVIGDRGVVDVVMHYPGDDGYEEQIALQQDEIGDIGTVQFNDQRQQYEVPVTVASDHVDEFIDLMQEGGFDQPGGWGSCEYPVDLPEDEQPPQERPEDGWGHCLLIVQDGEILSGYGVNQNLGEEFQDPQRQFAIDPTFVISVSDPNEAQEVRINLEEGALAAQLNTTPPAATSFLVSPVLAESFLQNSLITGVLAVLAVVLMVFLRYGEPRIAVPMSVTALSELYLLLGFASAVGLSLNLAHIAGFVAVIGTGVDDLIIIADDVLGQSDVRSRRVFDSRFRKAFWVIGTAAATTIVAMSPLALMSLGDLRGFAIITILGVLIGVAITRPAYGNILRMIKTDF